MKRIKILAAIALAGVLFAGCTKDNMDTLTAAAATNENATRNTTAVPPMIIYTLASEPMVKGQLVQWNTGYMTTGELIFEGTHVVGNMLSMEKFVANTNNTIKLFEPAILRLGTVTAQPNSFNYGTFTLQLDPADLAVPINSSVSMPSVNSVKPANSSAAAFFLGGIYNMNSSDNINGTFHINGIGIPVQVIINEQVLLPAQWISNITINDFNTYTAALSLDVNKVTDNITAEMLANAQKTNGTILITSASNQNLYGIILANLQNDMLQVQFSSQAIPSNPNPVSIAATASNN